MPTLKLPPLLAALSTVKDFEANDLVFRAGAPARHVHFLAHGRVVLRRFGVRGEAVSIHAAQAGEYFAEASLYSERYHCSAVVVQHAQVYAIASDGLRALLRRDPDFAMQWLAVVSRQLRHARARVERLCLKAASERVRHLLLTEGSGPSRAYTLRGSVKDLAVELGLTHEALYRTLAAMQRAGSIERDGQMLRLP